MPAAIALVVAGRCRPSPDRVPEGTSPDRDTGGIVTGHLTSRGEQRFLPMLASPPGGVGRIDRDDRHVLLSGHRHQTGFELAGGDAGDELPEPLAPSVLLPGLVLAEVEVLDADRLHAAPLGPAQQPADGMPDLRVTVISLPGQVVGEAARAADRVAVPVEPVGGEVAGVGVHADHALGASRRQREGLGHRSGPRCGEVPAPAPHVVVDAVGDGPVLLDAVTPLGATVRERDLGGENVPAVPGVGQVSQRCGQLDADLACGREADRLVAETLARLPVSGEEPALGFPSLPPFGLGELGLFEVVPVVEQLAAAAHDVHDTGLILGAGDIEAVLKDVQAAGLVKPLTLGAVSARGPVGAFLPDRQGQPVPQRPRTGLEGVDVCELAAARQCPLVVAGLGDAACPA
ncbi:hypothetical protein [Nonomuraea sp. NPDC048826]|uniref:hypothetical protein n=1 Tax=Nonomuraea sp. NPDC048826 TaxID=3364347 RepID=UPI00371E837F